MTEVLAFMAGNACLTLSLACVAVVLVATAAKAVLIGVNRTLRTVNILARGWPPEHLDADGDHVRLIEEETP